MMITASSHLHHIFEHTQPYSSSGRHSSSYCTSVSSLVSTGKDFKLGHEEAKAMREEMRQFREASERTQILLLEILRQGLL